MDEVDRIIEAASRILTDEGEPLGANDQWLTGRFCNVPSPRAAFEATVTAMAGLGLPIRCEEALRDSQYGNVCFMDGAPDCSPINHVLQAGLY